MEETNKKEVEAARADAIEKDQCFSKGRLRDEFRMKPKPEAEPVAFYKNGYGGKFGVYKISDCVPMKARSTKPPSEKQKRARAILAVKAKLKSNEAKTSCRAVQWLDENPLFLDTETTGLDDKAQILELAISDAQGSILLKTRLRPTVPIDREAEDIHGITAESLANLCIPVMLPTGSSDCDPPVLEVLPSHSSGCDPLRRRSCPIPKACRCVIART